MIATLSRGQCFRVVWCDALTYTSFAYGLCYVSSLGKQGLMMPVLNQAKAKTISIKLCHLFIYAYQVDVVSSGKFC